MAENSLSRPHTLLADLAQINLAGELAESSSSRLVFEAIGAAEVGALNFSGIAATLGGGKAGGDLGDPGDGSADESSRSWRSTFPPGSRGGQSERYRIADSYLRFWFRFIAPQLRNIEIGQVGSAVAAFRQVWPRGGQGDRADPAGRGTEACRPRPAGALAGIESVNAWWERTGTHEFDLVGAGHDGLPLAVGSVKWREAAPFVSETWRSSGSRGRWCRMRNGPGWWL